MTNDLTQKPDLVDVFADVLAVDLDAGEPAPEAAMSEASLQAYLYQLRTIVRDRRLAEDRSSSFYLS